MGGRRRAARQRRPTCPPAPTFASGWQLGEPDFVFEQPVEWTVKPDAQEPYLYFYEKIPFTEDKFASGVEMRPSNFSVVHHSGVYIIDIPDGYTVKDGYMYDPQGKQMPAYASPWARRPSVGDGAGRRRQGHLLRARPRLRAAPRRLRQAHPGRQVRALGDALQPDRPARKATAASSDCGGPRARCTHEVLNLQAGDPVPGSGGRGLYFAQGKEVLYESDDTTGRRGKTPTIPPYESNFKMMGITPVNEAITLYALTPHMHLRGKSMKWWVTYPDGREETILDVPNFDFNWQIQYELAEPLKVPAGSKITNVAIYDNSVKNSWNPAPEKEVYWSEQSWDEMYQPTTQFSVDSQDLTEDAEAADQRAAAPAAALAGGDTDATEPHVESHVVAPLGRARWPRWHLDASAAARADSRRSSPRARCPRWAGPPSPTTRRRCSTSSPTSRAPGT